MRIIKRNTGKTEVWIGKGQNNYEHHYGKYEISEQIKTVIMFIIIAGSIIIGSLVVHLYSSLFSNKNLIVSSASLQSSIKEKTCSSVNFLHSLLTSVD